MGYVYFIQRGEENTFKIGSTQYKVENRLSSIQSSSPEKLSLYKTLSSDSFRELERRIHKLFSDRRLSGEWFSITAQEVDALEYNKDVISYIYPPSLSSPVPSNNGDVLKKRGRGRPRKYFPPDHFLDRIKSEIERRVNKYVQDFDISPLTPVDYHNVRYLTSLEIAFESINAMIAICAAKDLSAIEIKALAESIEILNKTRQNAVNQIFIKESQ